MTFSSSATCVVLLSPWVKPYSRDTMCRVRRGKDSLIFMCFWSILFPISQSHYSPPVESIIDVMARYVPDVIVESRPSRMAMPCKPIRNRKLVEVVRTSIRFDPNPVIEEVDAVNSYFLDYGYAAERIRYEMPPPISRDPNDVIINQTVAYAVARFRAIELANGYGLVQDREDTELWRGVEDVDPNESRKLPVIWTEDYVTSFRGDPDRYASYGRVRWHGSSGIIPYTISRSNACR
eukprot:14316122-Heterocapsa_arctica.AAC.1